MHIQRRDHMQSPNMPSKTGLAIPDSLHKLQQRLVIAFDVSEDLVKVHHEAIKQERRRNLAERDAGEAHDLELFVVQLLRN